MAKECRILLTVTHVVVKDNSKGDRLSRQIKDNLEWTLTQEVVNMLCADENIGTHSIHLFASWLNNKLPNNVSFYKDAAAQFINAFPFKWVGFFNLFLQPRYPTLQSMLIGSAIMLNSPLFPLIHPRKPTERHPIADRLHLMTFLISSRD